MPKRRTRNARPKHRSGVVWTSLRWLIRHPQPFVALLIVAGAGFGGWHVITRSPAFEVTTIQLPPERGLRVSPSVMGQNLWAVNVHAVAQELKSQYPQAKRIRVLRQPPHTLRIEVQERLPLAQIRIGHWYQVASDGYILPTSQEHAWSQLPIIKGAEEPRVPLKAGRANESPRLQQALRVVKSLRRSSVLKDRHVTTVDVGNPSQLLFILNDGIEVRCGRETELAAQLIRLQAVLAVVTHQQMSVRYVDVRFQDPVIGPGAHPQTSRSRDGPRREADKARGATRTRITSTRVTSNAVCRRGSARPHELELRGCGGTRPSAASLLLAVSLPADTSSSSFLASGRVARATRSARDLGVSSTS